MAIARQGPASPTPELNSSADDEGYFLDTLFTIAGSGQTPAEELLADYHGKWHEQIDPIYTEYACLLIG